MSLVDADKDMTIYYNQQKTETAVDLQYNILYADGYTDGGFSSKEYAEDLLTAMIANQNKSDTPVDEPGDGTNAHGNLEEAKIIVRDITTTVTITHGEWKLA